MPIVKHSPNELAIHGGGPPAFDSKLAAFNPNVGDGHRFGELAERMFLSNEAPGKLVEECEDEIADWIGVRNAIGFSSRPSAMRSLVTCLGAGDQILAPSIGYSLFALEGKFELVDSDPGTYGMCPTSLTSQLDEKTKAVFASHIFGRPCAANELQNLCDDAGVPLLFCGHQALGGTYQRSRLGGLGRAEIFELGRDQLVHALDAAIVTTDDDLLAHRLRVQRSNRADGIDPCMGDAAAAMAIANIEASDRFIEANRRRHEWYLAALQNVPGIKLVEHAPGSNFQAVAIEVDARLCGLTRDALAGVLTAENIGCEKPFEFEGGSLATSSRLLQLPAGPAAIEEAVIALCKIIELSVVRSLESPDPIRLAA